MQAFIDTARNINADKALKQMIKASELGYLYPNVLQSWGKDDIIEHNGKTYYRDVNIFCRRVNSAVVFRLQEEVRPALDAAFVGEAVIQQNTVQLALRRGWLMANDQKEILDELKKRFQPPPS